MASFSTAPSSSSHYTTSMTKFTLKRTWTIEDFAFYRVGPVSISKPLESPVFYAPEHDLQFKVLFYPNGTKKMESLWKNHTSAFVQVKSISGGDKTGDQIGHWKEDAVIVIDYSVETNEENVKVYKKSPQNINILHLGRYSLLVNSPTSVSIDLHNREDAVTLPVRSNGELVLECMINVSYPTDSFSGICCSPSPVIEMSRSGDHFEKMKALLETGANSDITLVVEDQEFKVHKLHLATHSAVFAAMFEHEDTKEAIEKKVIIEDVSAEVMRTLLRYIYTGTVESKDDLSVELFSAADKYQVDALKVACERQLSLKLTTDSAFTSLLYADLHNATTLKENCIKFVAFHSMVSSTSPAWSQFTAAARPELVTEVLTRVIAKLNL